MSQLNTNMVSLGNTEVSLASRTGMVGYNTPVIPPPIMSPNRPIPLSAPMNESPILPPLPSRSTRSVPLPIIPSSEESATPLRMTPARSRTPSNSNLPVNLPNRSSPISSPVRSSPVRLSPSTYDISSSEGSHTHQSIESELANSGYLTVEKIITSSNDGRQSAEYLVVTTPYGQKAMVDLDATGYVANNGNTVFISSSDRNTSIPYSMKMGAMECMKDLACGAAFVCEGEVCMLKNDIGSMAPMEKSFVLAEEKTNKTAVMSGYPIALPVVKLSEIRANPYEVEKNIDVATRNVMLAAYDDCQKGMENLHVAIDGVHDQYKALRERQKQAFSDLDRVMIRLNEIRKANGKPVSDEDRVKARKIYYNLYKRYEMMANLMKMCNALATKEAELKAISNDMKEMRELIDREYSKLDKVYQPSQSMVINNSMLPKSTLSDNSSMINQNSNNGLAGSITKPINDAVETIKDTIAVPIRAIR